MKYTVRNKVAILTLNYNKSKMTIECINSILLSNYKNISIYVVDNGSELKDFQYLKNAIEKIPDNRLIQRRISPNRNYVGGMNYALEIANKSDADYFLVMNNDTIIDKNAIYELVKTNEKYKRNAIVTGKVYDFYKKNVIQTVGSDLVDTKLLIYQSISNEIDRGQFDEETEKDLIDDVFWLLPKKIYQEIGGYNTAFVFNGDSADYVLRAKKSGFKIVYCPNAKLWHKGSLSVGGRENNPFLSYWQTRSTLTFRYIHLNYRSFIRFELIIIRSIIFKYLKYIFSILSSNRTSLKLINASVKGLYDFHTIAKKDLKLQG